MFGEEESFLPQGKSHANICVVLAACRTEFLRLVFEPAFPVAAAVGARSGFVGVAIEPFESAMELDILCAGGDPPSIGGGEGEHSLHVPGHGHEAPLAAHFFQPAQ